jgi:ABC-2 type transport system permease protein
MRRGPGRAWTVARALVHTSLATAMQYRSDFLIDAATGAIRAVAAVAPVVLVFQHQQTLLDWTQAQVTLVIGLFFFMQAVIGGVVEPNLGEIVDGIRTGNLDLMLLKPADSQLLASVRRVAPGHLWDLLAALLVIGWALRGLDPVPTVGQLAVGALMVAAGLVSMYGLWLLAICTSFWLVRVDNLRFLLWAATDAGRFPLRVFADWVRFGLMVVVPVGLLTTFPVEALRGELTMGMGAFAVCVALAFLVGSRLAWQAALASYTSASS